MTSQSPGVLSMPPSPEGGFDLPSPTLTPGPSSPGSVQVSECSPVPSSASSCAYLNQVWIQDFTPLGMSDVPLPLQVPPRPQIPQPAFTTCYRLTPHQPGHFSWVTHRQPPMMPPFYRPPDYRHQMMELNRPVNYAGMQGRGGMGGFAIPRMRSTVQYHPPVAQHDYYNLPTPSDHAHVPNFGHAGPQYSHFRPPPQVQPQFRPHAPSLCPQGPPPQLFPQAMSQFCHPQSPACRSPQTQFRCPSSHFRPQLPPTSQLRSLTPLRSQTPTSLFSPQSPLMVQPQGTRSQNTALRPQTAPPKIATPQFRPQPSQSIPQRIISQQNQSSQQTPSSQQNQSSQQSQSSQHNFIDLTKDVYSTQQRTITCVRNYSSIPSPGPSSSSHTSQQHVTQPLPHQPPEGSPVPTTLELCVSFPRHTSPRAGHVIFRPTPIHATAQAVPSLSPAAARVSMPSLPLSSPFTPTSRCSVAPISTSSVPVVTSCPPTSASVAFATPSSPSPEITSSGRGTGNQPKKSAQNKKAVKRKPKAKPVNKKPRVRRTKKPTKPAEDTPPVTVVTAEDVEISEQEVEVVASDLTEMQVYVDFVKHFKSHHLKLGYGLEDIIQQVRIRYGKKIDLQCIRDFEDLLLQKERYVPLLEILDTWIRDTAKASGSSDQDIVMLPANSICPHRAWKQKRKQKTSVNTNVTLRLEEEFARKKSPTPAELVKLATSLGVEKDYVKNWFYNRRRKEKCMGKRPAGKEEDASVKSKSLSMDTDVGVKIPSILYDITVEVPSIHPRDTKSPLRAEYMLQN